MSGAGGQRQHSDGGGSQQETGAGEVAWKEVSISTRSVGVGLLVGSVLCCTNMYFGLQTGWVTMGSLQSALLGFGFFKLLQTRGWVTSFSAAENVIVQTTAVATATMPLAAGFVGIIPAFQQLTPEENPPVGGFSLSSWQLLAWGLALAFFGVFFAVPLREQVIVRERLPFPSGTATAKVIAILHGTSMQGSVSSVNTQSSLPELWIERHAAERLNHVAREADEAMLPSELAGRQPSDSMVSPFLLHASNSGLLPRSRSLPIRVRSSDEAHSSTLPLLDQLHSGLHREALDKLATDSTQWARTWGALLWSMGVAMALTMLANLVPQLSHFPVFNWLGLRAAAAWGWEVVPAFGYVGQGMIMGPRTTLSMLAGALLGYAWLGPFVREAGWAPGPIQDWQTGASGWVLWISLAVMLGDSLTSLALLTASYALSCARQWLQKQSYTQLHGGGGVEMPCKPIPPAWWISGLVASTILCSAVLSPMFGLSVWQPLIAVAVAMLVAVLAIRALGETDLNPVSGVGKLSQIVFAVLAPGNVVASLVAGAVAEAGAQQAGDMMQDFKTASLLGVCPRAQFSAMLIGAGVSSIVSVLAFELYTFAWQVPGPMFPVPTAQIWLSMARLLNGGSLMPHVKTAAIAAATAAAILPVIAAVLRTLAEGGSVTDTGGSRLRRAAGALLVGLPSGIGFAVGMYVSPKFTLPRVGGMLVEQAWGAISPRSHKDGMIVVASGLVLGEGTASLLLAIVKSVTGV